MSIEGEKALITGGAEVITFALERKPLMVLEHILIMRETKK